MLKSFSPSRRALSDANRLEKKSLLFTLEVEKKKKKGKNYMYFLRQRIILLS